MKKLLALMLMVFTVSTFTMASSDSDKNGQATDKISAIAVHKADKLAERFNLNADQKAQVEATIIATAKKVMADRESFKTKDAYKQALRSELKSSMKDTLKKVMTQEQKDAMREAKASRTRE